MEMEISEKFSSSLTLPAFHVLPCHTRLVGTRLPSIDIEHFHLHCKVSLTVVV